MLEIKRNYFNQKKIIGNKVFRILVIAIILFTGIMGLQYTICRNSSDGKNKIYLDIEQASGEIVCANMVLQNFIAYHDFDGISLLLDHNFWADFGYVVVDIYEETTNELVFRKAVPVWQISGDQYTFFASVNTILVENPTAYGLSLSFHGLPNGIVTAKTGYMPEEIAKGLDNGSGTFDVNDNLAFGFVTNYQKNGKNMILMSIAVIIACAAFILIFISSWSTKKKFLVGYYCLISAFFLIALTFAKSVNYVSYALSSGEDESIEILDDTTVDIVVTLPENDICGLELASFECDNADFSDETLEITMSDAATKRKLQTLTLYLKDIKSEALYIPFDDTYNRDNQIMFHIQSRGLTSSGIRMFVSKIKETNTQLYVSGTEVGYAAVGRLEKPVYQYDYKKISIFYVLAIVIGVGLFYLLYVRNIPLFTRNREDQKYWEEGRCYAPAKQIKGKFAFGLVLTIGVCLLMADYGYHSGVAEVQEKVTEELWSYTENHRLLPEGDNFATQNFTAGQDNLCGLGVLINAKGATDESREKIFDRTIHLRLRNGKKVLVDQIYTVGELDRLDAHLGVDIKDESVDDMRHIYLYLPFDIVQEKSAGQKYIVELKSDTTDPEKIEITGDENDSSKNIALVLCYESYQGLHEFYWTIVLAVAAIVISLYCVCMGKRQIQGWKIFIFTFIAYGLIYSIMIPPHCVPDESYHIQNIYQLSNHILGVPDAAGDGYVYMQEEDGQKYQKRDEIKVRDAISMERYRDVIYGMFQKNTSADYTIIHGKYTLENTTVWTYLPSSIGLCIARAFNYNYITMVMFARWANLLVATFLLVVGIRKCPIGKRGMITMALFPMFIQQSGSCSYDALILAGSVVFIGYSIHIFTEKDISVLDLFILLVAGIFILMQKKGIYLPLILIPVLIPQLSKNRKRILVFTVEAGFIILLACGYLIGMSQRLSGEESIELTEGSVYTLGYLLHHINQLLHLCENTIYMKWDELVLSSVANELGQHEIQVPLFIITAVCLIWYRSMTSDSREIAIIRKRQELGMWCLCGTGVIAIAVAFALTMSFVGSFIIMGMQGRYFIPYMFVGSILYAGRHKKTTKRPNKFIFYMSLIHYFMVIVIYVNVFGFLYWERI